MDVARTFDALRASARSDQEFPRWWCLSDSTEQEQARAYCQAYIPYYRGYTGGSMLTRQVISFTLPPPRSPNGTEASCNALGFALMDQLGQGWSAKHTGISDKERRLPYYFDMMSLELVVLDGVETALLQQGKTGPRLRRRDVLWLHQLFCRPSYERPASTGMTRALGNKQGLRIPVIALADDTMCQLLAQLGVAGPPDTDQASLPDPKLVDDYGASAASGALTYQDMNQLRAYLRLPHLDEKAVTLRAYDTNYVGDPKFGIARWEGRSVFFEAIEDYSDEMGKWHPRRYILLEATAAQLEESMRWQHRYPNSLRLEKNPVIGWFEREALS